MHGTECDAAGAGDPHRNDQGFPDSHVEGLEVERIEGSSTLSTGVPRSTATGMTEGQGSAATKTPKAKSSGSKGSTPNRVRSSSDRGEMSKNLPAKRRKGF